MLATHSCTDSNLAVTGPCHDSHKSAIMMNVSSGVIDTNNEAVAFLEQGRYGEAIEMLRTAHEKLKVLLELQNAIVAFPQILELESNTSFPDEDMVFLTTPIAEQLLSSKVFDQSSTALENVFTFFNRAFRFSSHENLDFASLKTQSRIQSTVLYNWALAIHCQAIECGSSKLLTAALHLYELSYSVLRDAWDGDRLEPVLLLLMSLFCNMGYIASNMFDLERTRYCMEWLKSAISWKGSASLEGDVYFFFFKNLSFVPMKEQVLAPAA